MERRGAAPVNNMKEESSAAGYTTDKEGLLALRRRFLCGAQSISYKQPLLIVKGRGAFLYDENDRPYLDLVNNVCHVGHCNERVVKAAAEQLATLNTNTRYLHPNIVKLAQRLAATMPEQLQVCFFVNSGAEANDLALRLARCYTGRRDILSMATGYHGATTATIEISPYKLDGKGGFVAPPYCHKVPIPDLFRGPYRYGDSNAGHKYASQVADKLAHIQKASSSGGIAAFFVEPVMSCAGQIVLPDGYLQEVFRHVRSAGGVCVSDEVQVGFGRVGTHFWGFQTQGVVPDIVTMGKPFGNGFPLAAVVTTKPIADAFANNGMEYFSTFGGNPVACAVGLAVLDVIAEEKLQDNALKVGQYFVEELRKLQAKYPMIIGDVRGIGLFLGVELIRDRSTLEPAPEETSWIAEAMKERGVLIGTDGPFHNVLKIKPPIVITCSQVDLAIRALDAALEELCAKHSTLLPSIPSSQHLTARL